jgi:hypothetical protein
MFRLPILVVALILFNTPLPAQTKGLSAEQKKFYKEITRHFQVIDSAMDGHYFEGLDSANKWLIQYLSQHKSLIQSLPDTFNYDLLYIAHANDGRLTLISWDTRRGGTMIEFTTMALYKTAKNLASIMLLDREHQEKPETFMHYNKVITLVNSEGKRIYLAWGNGQGSTALPWQELRAFSISRNLEMPTIFPGKTTSLYVEFDLNRTGDLEYLPTIIVSKDGRTIDVPLTDDEDRFRGNYQRYRFNGTRFIKKEIIKKS